VRILVRPFGYMAFGLALMMLWATSRLLGERHELGYFSARLHHMVGRYPEVSRWGVQTAWIAWGLLFALAISPLDPIASWWDEVALAALALLVSCHRLVAGRRDGH
jgi:hypothetical protein